MLLLMCCVTLNIVHVKSLGSVNQLTLCINVKFLIFIIVVMLENILVFRNHTLKYLEFVKKYHVCN
jgi:hypothetical protein